MASSQIYGEGSGVIEMCGECGTIYNSYWGHTKLQCDERKLFLKEMKELLTKSTEEEK